ncbi:glycosyltransferase family 4 protein [Pedobacter sp. V48]|uniref:glycosyltransferase family 4 protein n=1 Tax=Pedobacter sp. V48 TaxID=509635 RepID=UPI0003E572B8|nr:glycosyltransferase family 4 protein [Pedobacter sp. V48]ETZ24554.1 hypothetical protein N824_13630 [Pedobacter sp. V48]
MRILYIHQYFKTPAEPGGTRSYWVAKELVNAGHHVTMLTTSSSIISKKETKIIDEIEVVYLKVPYDQKMSILGRMKSFLSFMYKASVTALKTKDINLVIATSTPLTIGFPALLMKKIKNIPYVFEVRDLWPEVPIQMGGLKNSFLIRIAKWFERTIYLNAEHVIALSPGMADGIISNGGDKQNTTMIPNMAKINEFWPRAKNYELLKDLGLRVDSFKIVHFGSLGLANGANTIIESAKLLKGINVEFIFLGGGSTEESLIKLCEEYQIVNVHFLGKFPMAKTSEIVNFCDVSIVSFLDIPILYTNSPNKLFDSLSAGKPIIVNSAGWTKNLVEEEGCGYYVNPNNPEELADKIVFLQNNPEIVQRLGEESRKLAEHKFDKSILCREFSNVINNLNINQIN